MKILNHLPNYPFNEIYTWQCQRLLFGYTRCLGASFNQAHRALTKKVHKVGLVGGANYRWSFYPTQNHQKNNGWGSKSTLVIKQTRGSLKGRERLSRCGSELFEG